MRTAAYLHDDGKDIISNQGSFLPILGVDVIVHDLHTAHGTQECVKSLEMSQVQKLLKTDSRLAE